MSMDGAVGPAIGTIGTIMAVGLVSKVAQGTMKSVGNSYNSNRRNYHAKRTPSHPTHKRASSHRTTGHKEPFSIWKHTGF